MWADSTVCLPAGGLMDLWVEADGGHCWKGLWAPCTEKPNKRCPVMNTGCCNCCLVSCLVAPEFQSQYRAAHEMASLPTPREAVLVAPSITWAHKTHGFCVSGHLI